MASGSTNFYRLCERQWREAIQYFCCLTVAGSPRIILGYLDCECNETSGGSEAIHAIVTMKGIVREPLINLESRHCERREAIHCINEINILWIAASLRSSQ